MFLFLLVRRALINHILNIPGISNQALVLKENTLKTGTQYMIKLTTTISTRSGPSVVIMDIVTNYPPYNGACTVTPTEGDSFCLI